MIYIFKICFIFILYIDIIENGSKYFKQAEKQDYKI